MKTFLRTCVGWPEDDVQSLMDMIDSSISITRATFRKNVNTNQLVEIELSLGYDRHHSQGLTMAADWHVSYHRSKLQGKRVYYFRWSGIEHVFA